MSVVVVFNVGDDWNALVVSDETTSEFRHELGQKYKIISKF